jgi:hypothetical protein
MGTLEIGLVHLKATKVFWSCCLDTNAICAASGSADLSVKIRKRKVKLTSKGRFRRGEKTQFQINMRGPELELNLSSLAPAPAFDN